MFETQSPSACAALVDDGWTYLDVRTPDEFDAGHAVGSVNVPFSMIGGGGLMPNPEFLQVVGALYDRAHRFVVGCSDGGRSGRACQMLTLMGFANVVQLEGGFAGLRDASGQIEVAGWADNDLPRTAGTDEGSYGRVRARARG